MSYLDDLLKEKEIFYLKDRMNECGINTVGDLEYIFSDEDISQIMVIKPLEKNKIKAIIKNVKGEEEQNKDCKNDYNKSSSCSSVDETEVIYETINGPYGNFNSQTNYMASESTYEYEQPHPSNFPQLQSEMHNNGHPSQVMHPNQNNQSSIYPDRMRKQDSNSQNEQFGQRMQGPNSQYDANGCSNLDHDKLEINYRQTNEFEDIGSEKKKNRFKISSFRKSKTPKENVEKNSSKQKEMTKKKIPRQEYREISDIQSYTQPQTQTHPDSLPRANPRYYQNINLWQNKMEKFDFSSDEGKRSLDIISKLCDVSKSELIQKTITKDLILQDRIGFALKKENFKNYQQVKQYLSKFKESQDFLNIQTGLTSENTEYIQQFSFDDIRKVSKELNIIESVIKEKMLEYEMSENDKSHYSKKQVKSLLKLSKTFNKLNITIDEYKRINIYPHKYYVEKLDKDLEATCFDKYLEVNFFDQVCQNIIAIAFHCMKCNLPFDDITDILKEKVEQGMPGSNHELFHLIFQHSTPIVKALCIDLYSFCSPVPFYYPLLNPINDKQSKPVFKLCHELWFTIPPCFAIASFGLGSASYLPVGKSELLNKIFNTDFTLQNQDGNFNPFHFQSIDVQFSKNIQFVHSKIFAYFDCHGGAPIEIIKTLCKYVNMIIIHVLEKDIEHNRELFNREMKYFHDLSKIIVILVRDSKQTMKEERKGTHYFVYVPKFSNISKGKVLKEFKELFRKIIHSKPESPLTVDHSFIQKVLRERKDEEFKTINDTNSKITRIIEIIEEIQSQKSGLKENDFLSFYPIFIEYMKSFYKASRETDQNVLDQFNHNRELQMNQLSNTTCSPIIPLFLDLFDDKYSSILLYKLSQYFAKLNAKGLEKIYKHSNDILWREALLSFKHNDKMKDYNMLTDKLKKSISKQIMEGEPLEIIDGDNLVFSSKDLDALLGYYYDQQKNSDSIYNKGKKFPLSAAPTVISIFGPQSSGKSTLLNYCFGCKFITSAGRCTQGVYGSLFQMDEILNNSRNLLILDTEGLNSIESKTDAKINFDQTMALFCLAVSQIVIINVKGEIGLDLKRLLQVCAYSLNRLKVNKVNLPKIFLVLNQQADPDVTKYAGALKHLMDSLDSTFYTADSECVRISDFIKVSTNDLFVLPSAFNVNCIDDSPLCENDSSAAVKLESTKIFSNKCSVLRSTIFGVIRKRNFDKPPFESVSEWIQMAGQVWETCLKYQDIVMYRDLEEIVYSEQLRSISLGVIDEEIYRKQLLFEEALDRISKEIKDIKIYSDTINILADKMERFDETLKPCGEECKRKFDSEEKILSLSGQFSDVYDQTISNLNRLILNYRKNYEDKIKFQIKHVLLEVKIRCSMKSFQEKIEFRIDDYINFSQKEKFDEFDKIWRECYEVQSEDFKAVRNEHFENIYRNFKIECNFFETRESIWRLFREKRFKLDDIITEMERNIMYGLKNPDIQKLEKCYFCILSQSHGDFNKVRPHSSRTDHSYLSPDFFIKRKEIEKRSAFRIRNTANIFPKWIPTECYPFVDSCSGDFNHYEILWGKCSEKSQILLLTSKLRNPNDSNNSCWDTLIQEVREQALTRLKSDCQLSQTTIKQLISDLYSSIKVVNHEIKYIRTMLSNQAERQLSTLLFSYAFREYWAYQADQIKKDEARREEQKVGLRDYFFQKIDIRKMLKGEWDTKNMTASDKKISEKFAMDYVASIKRSVLTNMNLDVERSFEELRESLTMEQLLLKANSKLKEEIERDPNTEVTDTNHFVIKYICERNTLLEKNFHIDWCDYQEKLKMKINQMAKENFNGFVNQIINQFDFLSSHFQTDFLGKNCYYSDSNFPLRETIDPTSVQAREAPFKAMSIYLSKYLNPMVSQEELSIFLRNEFNVDGVKLGRSPKSVLPLEKCDYAIDKENFERLENTNIFNELIFDISLFITNFKNILSRELCNFRSNSHLVTHFKRLENEYLKDALGCNSQCPSCGKFCERGIHNDGSKCQILTGHQFSSMGGKAWKNDEKRTAILFMCDDYKDHMTVKLPEKSMKWSDFKLRCGNEWNWDLPEDPKLQEENKDMMKKIWTKFGRGILKYYSREGTNISYVPLSLMDYRQYYICFVIDGTASMDKEIEKARLSVSKIVNSYQEKGSRCFFRIVIYRDHCDEYIIETFPSDQNFTADSGKVMDFLEKVKANGGGDMPEAVLDGLATAVNRTNWKNDANFRNIIVHIFDAPPHGNFPDYQVHRSDSSIKNCCCCNHSTLCPFDWESHVWQPMKKLNLFYHGINTDKNFPGFETTMKKKLGGLCGEFQVCGKEQVDTVVVDLFINFHM